MMQEKQSKINTAMPAGIKLNVIYLTRNEYICMSLHYLLHNIVMQLMKLL